MYSLQATKAKHNRSQAITLRRSRKKYPFQFYGLTPNEVLNGEKIEKSMTTLLYAHNRERASIPLKIQENQ